MARVSVKSSLSSFHRVITLLLAGVAKGFVVAGSTLTSLVHEPEPQNFQESGLRTPIETVDCTLSNGTESTCLKLELCALPDDTELGYHYHAGADFPNLSTCLVGVTSQDNFSTTGKMGIGSTQLGGPGGPNMDFSALAAKLGVDETALMNALHDAGAPPPDIAAVAETLAISEDTLRAVMPARP